LNNHRFIAVLGAALSACNLVAVEPWDDDDRGTGGFDSEQGVSGLGNPLRDVHADPSCEEFHNNDGTICRDIEGATTFFVADASIEDTAIDGFFYYVHYANTAWIDTPAWRASEAGEAEDDQCLIAWKLWGTLTDRADGPCPDCQWGVTYSLDLDDELTDCPGAKVVEVRSAIRDAEWALRVGNDGALTGWDTQREWAAHGNFDRERGFVLWSDVACEWYGSGECT
jgi:hypothetical protein